MAHRFMIWDQGNDGRTMAIRVKGVHELAQFARSCTQPDIAGKYKCLDEYLEVAARTSTRPLPYTRIVEVVWLNRIGYGEHRFFQGRTLVVTYSGNRRQKGGFASQAYCIVDPNGYPELRSHHRSTILVEYVSHAGRDALVVLP